MKTIKSPALKMAIMLLPFGLFGGICLLGNIVFVILIILRLYKFRACRNFARDLVYFAWRFFVILIEFFGYISCKFANLENVNLTSKPHLIIANHPSLLDVVLILSHIRRINCVIKADLARNIFLYPAIKASGYILNTNSEEMLEVVINCLKNGESLLIFPEGTRTQGEIVFHKAASYIAIHASCDICPLIIEMHPKALQKGAKWYDTAMQKLHYEIIAKNIIQTRDFAHASNALACRSLHAYLNEFYQQEVKSDR